MTRMTKADAEALCLYVPKVPDPGGFVPHYCCVCGIRLFDGWAHYFEGPVCYLCSEAVKRGVFIRPDTDPRAEGVLT